MALIIAARGVAYSDALAQCHYPPQGPPPLPKDHMELIRRIHARVVEANPNLEVPLCDELHRRSCALVVAGALAQAHAWRLPADLVTAIAYRESKFNLHVDHVAQRIAEGRAIGPMQVRPIAFRDVGMDPESIITMPVPAKIQYAVSAGLAYLTKLRDHYLPGESWCAVLHAYNVGPAGYREGKRNHRYVTEIIAQAKRYTELRT